MATKFTLQFLTGFDKKSRGSPWDSRRVSSQRYTSLVAHPPRRPDSKHESRRRRHFERSGSMLERLQSCLCRAEANKNTASTIDNLRAVQGNQSIDGLVNQFDSDTKHI